MFKNCTDYTVQCTVYRIASKKWNDMNDVKMMSFNASVIGYSVTGYRVTDYNVTGYSVDVT